MLQLSSRRVRAYIVGLVGTFLLTPGALAQSSEFMADPDTQCQRKPDPSDHAPVRDLSRMIEVPSDGIERYMQVVPRDPALPQTIQGLWWMDGNPLGDIAVTLASSSWDPATRTAQLAVYGEGNYSFRSSDSARRAYNATSVTQNTYAVQFNADYTDAKLTPTHVENGRVVATPESVVKFTMHLVADGHWVRESYLNGVRLPDYQFRRIVRVDGQRDPAYADYVRFASTYSTIFGHF